jgi:hypothetical protein
VVSRSSRVSSFSRKLTSRAWCTAKPKASELFFRSGSCSPYLNHQRAWHSKKQRTWLGERTEAIAGLATTAPFAAGNLVSATSGATISSVKERSGRGAKSGKSCKAGKANCTR